MQNGNNDYLALHKRLDEMATTIKSQKEHHEKLSQLVSEYLNSENNKK